MQLLAVLEVSLLGRPHRVRYPVKGNQFPCSMEMGHLKQYIDNNQMISGVPMETLQNNRSFCAKITMKQLMSHETVLNVTENGCIKAVRILATLG
jgi:hypothetical protein